VHELVNILGGSVHLQSTPGQGTTITIKIPPLISGSAKNISAHGNEVLFAEGMEF
jgi:hypothetical protein